jgi:uncharacterized membrane protein
MKPLIVLIVVFGIALLATLLLAGQTNWQMAGRIAMSAMLLFTAIGHFAFTKGMAMMIPSFVPYKSELVYVTGVIEILAAIGLLIPGISVITGWLLILFFIFLLPANIYAAWHQVDYQKGDNKGPGKSYLWFRVPLQLFFIAWVYFSAVAII